MEESMPNEESNISTPGSAEIDDSTSETPSQVSSRRETVNRNVYIMLDVNHRKVEPQDVIEYEWPVKSGDRWFLQEQIGELLDIKSFSRKYPDLTRRKVNHEERDHLEHLYNVHKLLNETQLRDMNAMRSSEIHDLMVGEYPDIYMEYKKIVGQREREILQAKAKEMEAIKNDSVKMAELRRTALASAAEFNKELQNSRKSERKHFWDIQTNIIQSKLSNWRKMTKEATRPSPYPVALIPGQFQEYYKRFTKEELMRLPVGTVLDSSYLFPTQREPSPPPLTIAEQDLIRVEREAAMRAREEEILKAAGLNSSGAPGTGELRRCEACEKTDDLEMLCCSMCKIVYHPKCIEMPDRMAAIVKTYEWNCVDCRLCSVCNEPDKESSEEILFCDRCDRGFHGSCVGVKTAPRGSWICNQYCDIEERTPRRATRRQSDAVGMR